MAKALGPGLMTTDEEGCVLHIPPQTLRKWCRSKKISDVGHCSPGKSPGNMRIDVEMKFRSDTASGLMVKESFNYA
jgi:hypothetical protein